MDEPEYVYLEGGQLDIGIFRAMTKRERRVRPLLRLLYALRLHRLHLRLHRWAAPETSNTLDVFIESFRAHATTTSQSVTATWVYVEDEPEER